MVAVARDKKPPSTLTEQILSFALTSLDVSSLSVVELTFLAGTNVYFYQMQWPRSSVLWHDRKCQLDWDETEDSILSKLEELGERLENLRSPAIALGADHVRAWAEEDRCRATWAIAALLSKVTWENLESAGDREDLDALVRLLGSNLVVPAPWASLATARALAGLVSYERGSNVKVHELLAEEGVGDLLLQLLQHSSPQVQEAALRAISGVEGGYSLGLPKGTISAVVSIIGSEWDREQLLSEALLAVGYLAEGKEDHAGVKRAIPRVVKLLGHQCDGIKCMAVQALRDLIGWRGDDLTREACKHGCVPKLIDCWWNGDVDHWQALECFASVTKIPDLRLIALRNGILPILFQSLEECKPRRDSFELEEILDMLLAYKIHVPQALLQETAARRTAALRQLIKVAVSPRGPRAAHLLLEHLFLEDASLQLSIRQINPAVIYTP